MTDIVTASVKGIVRNFLAATMGVATEAQLPLTAHGAVQTADVHGQYFEANYRGGLFSANVTAVTIPVIVSALVSVFTLFNPAGSGVTAEVVETILGQVVASTVVDTVGWYSANAARSQAATATTKITANSGRVQDPASNKVGAWSAFTYLTGYNLTREDIVGINGGVTDIGQNAIIKSHNGKLILPEGVSMSLAMSTAAGATSGNDIQVTWVESPK